MNEHNKPDDIAGQRVPQPPVDPIIKTTWAKAYARFLMRLSPQQNIFYGFMLYTVAGTFILCLPLCQKVTVNVLDHLFIATSAISTTGLATISVSDSYTFLGQCIILILIQAGGIGYMTFTSFILLANKAKFTHWHEKVLRVEFTLPKDLGMREFLRSVIVFTVFCELAGAVALTYFFSERGMSLSAAVWHGLFHSISAFCTAGFALFNNSFEDYTGHLGINVVLSTLSILGGLGFIVVTDLWGRAKGNSTKTTFTTRIIVGVYLIMQSLGTFMFFVFEPTVASLPFDQRLLSAFFQAMTAITTVGFNTVPIGALALPVLLGTTFIMYVGASPSGTGGGMKSTTLSAISALMYSRIRGLDRVLLMGKKIPIDRLFVATSTFIFYTALIFLGTFLLSFSEKEELQKVLFEAVSAIGTVGLSTGITGTLSSFGKVVVILLMFIGRLGVITFGLAIMARKTKPQATTHLPDEDLAV